LNKYVSFHELSVDEFDEIDNDGETEAMGLKKLVAGFPRPPSSQVRFKLDKSSG
jgi:hypothetical protein